MVCGSCGKSQPSRQCASQGLGNYTMNSAQSSRYTVASRPSTKNFNPSTDRAYISSNSKKI